MDDAFRNRPGEPPSLDGRSSDREGSLFGGIGALCSAAVRLI
ncbi:hypothetical protein [Nocardia fluminea]